MLSGEAMPGPSQTQPQTPAQAASSDSAGAEAPTECSFAEQELSFTSTDLNFVEMTEVEYTQLQHILYSHMETQTAEGEIENRLNPAFFSASSSANQSLYQSSNNPNQVSYPATSSANASMHPASSQSNPASDSHFLASGQCLGHVDIQELKMMLLSDPSLPLNTAAQLDKTPHNSGEAPAPSLVRMKNTEAVGGSNKENISVENSASALESRSKSTVRVRLEDRFNSIQSEIPRCQESQETGVTLNNLVTLIRHPSELMGVPLHQQQSKCTTLVKNKTATAAGGTALQFTYPLFTASASGSANTGQVQPFQDTGNLCHMLESARHQDLGLPRSISFCYQQEMESSKQTLSSRNKALPEQVWIKVGEETLCRQTVNKRSRSRVHQVDAGTERRALGDIQNVPENQSTGSAPGGQWSSTQSSSSEQKQSGQQGANSQRRERHNRMERDRRRRIRICCDELNLLVPFCNAETDKATTLQWTTAFLKYIQERHGDVLKKKFSSPAEPFKTRTFYYSGAFECELILNFKKAVGKPVVP
nr:PREDICTED: transcription factor-like 5 protein isoform X2 [Latimeria chalumnae]|eukprot:XP_014342423.1 PREDICTED: transcription factor-like 5 protein isoform X2 [Latimeria chalumnae]